MIGSTVWELVEVCNRTEVMQALDIVSLTIVATLLTLEWLPMGMHISAPQYPLACGIARKMTAFMNLTICREAVPLIFAMVTRLIRLVTYPLIPFRQTVTMSVTKVEIHPLRILVPIPERVGCITHTQTTNHSSQ